SASGSATSVTVSTTASSVAASSGAAMSSTSASMMMTCGTDEKSCNSTCVKTDLPAFGCAQPGCAQCSGPPGSAACAQGACVCNPPYRDCTGDPGCESDTTSDLNHCGECNVVCS